MTDTPAPNAPDEIWAGGQVRYLLATPARLQAEAMLGALAELFDQNLCFDGDTILIRCPSHAGALQGRANKIRNLIALARGDEG